jgi:Domain of unknown function (DUF4338)
MSADASWIPFEPEIGSEAGAFRAFAARFKKTTPAALRRELLAQVTGPQLNGDLSLRFAQSLLLDLVEQGWQVYATRKHVYIRLPREADETPDAAKDRIRKAHLVERDGYLRQRPVREFIASMEQRRLTPMGWHCIYSVMRDGADLAGKLRSIAGITDDAERSAALGAVIQPYIQFVEPGAVCEHTGIPLSDIWRYFRLTWVNVPRSVPGRSMMVLIRDAAAPNHPVIGIAALGSSVVQSELRDNWIGWNAGAFVERLQAAPSAKDAAWLLSSVQELIDDVYTKDLVRDGILARRELRHPTPETIATLREEAARAKSQHQRFPDAPEHKRRRDGWQGAAEMHLFRAKRCERLAKLLAIRAAFDAAGFDEGAKAALVEALKKPAVRTAAGQLVRHIKAQKVGIDMLDITVCGAIAPYNRLLGGKLVCALLASPEVAAYYNTRYARQESVIASSMKGAAIRRKPHLVLLCTTSLYGAGSSQYNRIRIPAGAVGGDPESVIEYKQLGLSKGFGSFHFSKVTTTLIDTLLARQVEGSKVNSIFGEGVNPLMRKIRQALELVRLPSDQLLNHGNRRVIYVIPLAKNFREMLLGRDVRPKYFLPLKHGKTATEALTAFWRRRWLARRIEATEVLQDVERHTLVYPVTHGARVPPDVITAEDDGDLFS